ncbi:MAG: hypothetical protein AMXMBFR77_00740 [Phycisphaerales bacterium]|nr:MAG: hypothetical protein BroJett004_06620 [Planctomycetota bacterium]
MVGQKRDNDQAEQHSVPGERRWDRGGSTKARAGIVNAAEVCDAQNAAEEREYQPGHAACKDRSAAGKKQQPQYPLEEADSDHAHSWQLHRSQLLNKVLRRRRMQPLQHSGKHEDRADKQVATERPPP